MRSSSSTGDDQTGGIGIPRQRFQEDCVLLTLSSTDIMERLGQEGEISCPSLTTTHLLRGRPAMAAADLTLPPDSMEVPGYPQYRADVHGDIWSCRRWGRWKRIKPYCNPAGRPLVGVWDADGNRKVAHVYRLVLMAFTGLNPSDMDCCHNDGNPLNNRPSNLRWDTRAGNMADTLRHGTHNRGTRNGAAKLEPAQVYEVRRRIAAGHRQKDVALAVGISQALVSLINTRKVWSHLE